MKLVSKLNDGRINAINLMFEIRVDEYLDIAKKILLNNEFQRRRVKSSPTLYSLLKDDLLKGCIIPPIVLAIGSDVEQAPANGAEADFIQQYAVNLLILDGLQRTHSMLELERELISRNDDVNLSTLNSVVLRIEVYVGMNRLSILYRMLTLNTGQTPMSLRQQVEILYLDYVKIPLGGIKLIREADESAVDQLATYNFKAMIDGFNSYLERNELPIDRYDLLESVKSLEKLSKESQDVNLFKDFAETYHQLVIRLNNMVGATLFTADSLEIQGQPFGVDVRRIFSKEQSIAGFGAAIAKLRDFDKIKSFADVRISIENLSVGDDPVAAISALLKRLELIRQNSKKIGNSQRLFFHHYYRELFNPDSDAYRNVEAASEAAYRKYESLML